MGFVDWYARDSAWNARNGLLPNPARETVVRDLTRRLAGGMTLVRVTNTASQHRLLLCKAPGGAVVRCARTFVPFEYCWEEVTIIGSRGGPKVAYNDPFPDGGDYQNAVLGSVRPLPDHVRLLAMFSRWRDRCGARAVAMRLCLLALEQCEVLRVLIDMGL